MERSIKYENDFIKRLNKYCTIEKAIKSYKTGSSKNSKIQKDHLRDRRKRLKEYFIAFPQFKERVDFILQTIKEEKRQPKEVTYNDSYEKKYDKIVYDLRRCGVTQKVIAKYLNVTDKTLIEWRKKHVSFADAWHKVQIDDLIDTSNAVQRASTFYKTETVRKEEGLIEMNGEQVPISKTITVVTEHPPVMAAVKLKLAQANNRIDNSNKKLLGYVPPVDEVEDKPINIDINLKGSDDDFTLNGSNEEEKEETES